MSSKFSSSFLSKSPLLAGGYASGVDGMRYVSPKQPENKSVPSPKVKKKEERPKLEKVSTLTPEGINIPETKFPSVNVVTENRAKDRIVPGKTVEKFLRPEDFEGGAKNPEYIKKKKDLDDAVAKGADAKYKDKKLRQNQSRNITNNISAEGIKTTITSDWGNVGDEFEITEEN